MIVSFFIVISSHAQPSRSHSLISLLFQELLAKIAEQFGVSRVVVQNKNFLLVNSLNSMLEEPLASNTSEDNYLVTAVISHVVKPGRDEGYEAWFHPTFRTLNWHTRSWGAPSESLVR